MRDEHTGTLVRQYTKTVTDETFNTIVKMLQIVKRVLKINYVIQRH